MNNRLEHNLRAAMHDPDEELSPEDVVAAMTSLERDSECARAEALTLELDYVRKQLNDLISSRAKKVLHVNRGPDRLIRDIIEL